MRKSGILYFRSTWPIEVGNIITRGFVGRENGSSTYTPKVLISDAG